MSPVKTKLIQKVGITSLQNAKWQPPPGKIIIWPTGL
jgi:hypothetical protein